MKSKYSELIKDLSLFAISTFIPKAIVFLLVPIYTNRLSTAEYGIVDMITTTVSVLVPFLTLDISDSVLRFTIEDKQNVNPYKFALNILHVATSILIFLVIVFKVTNLVGISSLLCVLFTLQFYFTALYGINISYLRATDRVGLLTISSIVNTISLVVLNILLLVKFDMGINGYLLSNIIALLLVNILIMFFTKINIRKKDTVFTVLQKREMISYSTPLIASNLSWWINSASDRYFIIYILGLAENGIYSVAYKIPTILQLFQSIFSQAWLLSIYREYNKSDGKEFVSKIYNLYNGGMCTACSILIIMDIPLAHFLYANEFFKAWKYVPILLISVIFIANAGFFETIITLFKKTRMVAITAIMGAIINLILNYFLISMYGVMGAAVATVLGYLAVCIPRIILVYHIYPLKINWSKHIFLWILLLIESIFMINNQSYLIGILIFLIMCILNCNIFFELYNKFMLLIKRK